MGSAADVVGAFQSLVALVVALGLGLFIVAYLIAQVRAVSREYGSYRSRRTARKVTREYERRKARGDFG